MQNKIETIKDDIMMARLEKFNYIVQDEDDVHPYYWMRKLYFI